MSPTSRFLCTKKIIWKIWVGLSDEVDIWWCRFDMAFQLKQGLVFVICSRWHDIQWMKPSPVKTCYDAVNWMRSHVIPKRVIYEKRCSENSLHSFFECKK
jgi:hypothetical protein